ncbi:MAG: TonB-dependent receptor [Phaeodactylibacter sp.]|nr:TonB-dependent receptor [Phaeodactylibacter sp.]
MHSYILSIAFFFWGIGLAMAQAVSVTLLDETTQQPIVAATFEYGEQAGLTDEQGQFMLQLQTGEVLVLSHVSYGTWTLDVETVQTLAQNGTIYRSALAVELYPVTVLAVRPGQAGAEQIGLEHQDFTAHDAAALLRQTPAFSSIQKSGNYGFDPVFRGFKYDQLNVVLNGAQSATAACPNRMDPPTSQMAPNMTDRIEILKGPHALRYGTGLGATINFVPTALRFTKNTDVYGRASTAFESNGAVLRGEGQVGLSGKRYDFSLLAAWSQGDDYQAGDGSTVQADFERGSFGANLGLKLTDAQQLRVSAVYNIARDADFPALPMDLRRDDTWLFNARHDITVGGERLETWNTTVFASVVQHLMDNLLKPLDPRMMDAATNAETYNYGGRTEGLWRTTQYKLYGGADLRVEGASGLRTRSFLLGPNTGTTLTDNAWQEGQILKVGAFAELQRPFAQHYQLVLSARVELNQAAIRDAEAEFLAVYPETEIQQLNPSLSVGVLRQFERGWSAGLFLGRVQRSGSLTERFINYFPVGQDPYEMLGNPQLKPEVNNQADLSIKWKRPKTTLQLDGFVGYLQDYISSQIDTNLQVRIASSPGVRQFLNIEAALKTGFEFSWSQVLGLGLQHQLALAYTYGQDLSLNEPLPEIAPLDLRYTLRGQYFGERLQPQIRFRQVLEQARISTEFGETTTPAFTLIDLQIAYQINDVLRIQFAVDNIFNANYYEHLSRAVRGQALPIYARGRNFTISASATF